MIEVKNLSKSYGNINAVRNISFTVNDCEVLGLLGANGAGKTTTMNILAGYLAGTGGEVLIDGRDISTDPIGAKKNVGYLPEQPPLYQDMTVDEYLNFVYGLKHCKMPKKSHLGEIKTLTGIEDVRSRVIRNLSKGYKQRTGLAGALVGNPNTLILDEPTVGLDPKQMIEMRSLIKKLGRAHTVILSSHILTEVQAVCGRIAIIDRGKLIAADTEDNLSKDLSAGYDLTLRIEGAKKDVLPILRQINNVSDVQTVRETEKNVFEYELNAKSDIRREVFRRMSARNMPILYMKNSELSLEEIFLKLTAGSFYGKGGDAE